MKFGLMRFVCLAVVLLSGILEAADWPMWRFDAARSAASPEALPGKLYLEWERQYTPRTPVWEDPLNQDLMPYDLVFEPVVLGKRLFVGFNDADKMVALDTESGEELWVFYADGPVRFPAVAWEDRLFFVSDDGFLYCLNAADGALVWKFRGGPRDRKILGNSRLISTWPARGGPVIADGVVYFAAGIWPFMGTFIYALDAKTGAVIWLNDSDGPTFQQQPHGGALSFGGIGPQGMFVVSGDKLLVPGGRSVPAVLERASGKVLHYKFAENNKTGGSFVCADADFFFNHHRERVVTAYGITTGEDVILKMGGYPVVTDTAYFMSGAKVQAYDSAAVKAEPKKWKDAQLWEVPVDASGDLIKAGDCLYASGEGHITAIKIKKGGKAAEAGWSVAVEGRVERLIAADGRLFAVTLDGRILAFGLKKTEPAMQHTALVELKAKPEAMKRAKDLLDRSGVTEGYCLLYGAGDGELLAALVLQSKLDLIAFDPDPVKVAKLRARYDAAGLYGKRVAVCEGRVDAASCRVPPYVASLTVVCDSQIPVDAASMMKVVTSMRPYGGVAWFEGMTEAKLAKLIKPMDDPKLAIKGDGLVAREGPLEGAGQWTHILGNAAQTGKSDDTLVRLPLGLLWFGGNSHVDVLTRHGHGPPEQVVGGRLFIEGMDCFSARDVYTGRVLWKTPLDKMGIFGVYYNETYKDTPTNPSYNQVHIPGANARGTNFVAAEDGIYVAQEDRCSVLNPVTGEIANTFVLPHEENAPEPAWGYIGVYKDLLIAGSDFAVFTANAEPPIGPDPKQAGEDKNAEGEDFSHSASQKLVVMDRHTGEVRWSMDARHAFLHNGTVIGKDLLFSLDKLPPYMEDLLKRRGQSAPADSRLIACDVATGKVLWEKTGDISGSFLCYSEQHDILLHSTRPSRDSLRGEDGKRITAFRGTTGEVVWDKEMGYPTFPLLYGDKFISEAGVFDLKTGEPALCPNPLTGEPAPWHWRRTHGCNYPIASESLLTFRSGAAGFYDFANASGTGNLGGFRSSCTSNLIAADGLLNAPDYTRTCQCSYQNQTSLAMAHDPDAEVWTFNEFAVGDQPIRRIGINLGAPGDRRMADGLLWIEYPVTGSPSPDVVVAVQPENVQWFLHHSMRFEGEGLPWVAASGGEGIASITVKLAPGATQERMYTVRLHFAEPRTIEAGARVFNVSLQGRRVLDNFDIVKETGGPLRSVVKQFDGIPVKDELTVALDAASPASAPPLLCGIEIVLEDGK